MHISYYITAHGYGHGVRSCCIINGLPSEVNVTIQTDLPQSFLTEEINRPFFYRQGKFDCGCVQIDGVAVDVVQTLSTYKKIADKNRTIIDSEVNWCKKNGVTCIVTDSTPFAIDVAREASIPSVVITNFTWFDIYNEYVNGSHEFYPYLEEIRSQYCSADLFLALFPSNPMVYLTNRNEVPIISREGVSSRDKIIQRYNLRSEKNIGLIYLGEHGMRQTKWAALETLTDWEFLSLYPVNGCPKNLHVIKKDFFRYQDLTASVDVVISKPGYGVVSECMINGVPLMFIPRENFAEYPVLVKAIENWGGGYFIPDYDFHTLNWKPYLDTIVVKNKPIKVVSDGVNRCVDAIVNLCLNKICLENTKNTQYNNKK